MRTKTLVLLLTVYPCSVWAGEQLTPYASAQIERNSNIFSRSDTPLPAPPPAAGPPVVGILLPPPPIEGAGGDLSPADTVMRYIGGLDVKLPWGNQLFRATAEARRFEYKQFTRLDHDEHLLGVGLDWRLTSSRMEGALDYRQERRMAVFAERSTAELTLDDERIGTAAVDFDIATDWTLETELESRDLKAPLPEAPEFRLKEHTLNVAIKRLYAEMYATGVYGEYVRGQFDGINGASRFQQASLGLTAAYFIEDLGRVGAEIGYTVREDEGSELLSALTGLITYRREWTVKTSLDVQAFSRLRSYASGANSVEELGGDARLSWLATEKFSITGEYQLTHGRFEDAGAPSMNRDRRDTSHAAALTLNYRMLTWLTLRTYGGYQQRDSNQATSQFDTTLIGAELKVRFE